MDSIERTWAALEFRPPDRVPVDLHNFLPAAAATGLPLSQVFRDGEVLAAAMLDAWREYGHDMVLLENGTGCNAEACGAEVVYRPDGAPVVAWPLLHAPEDVRALRVPDPETTFPMCEILRATRILAREIGDRAWIVARADQGPFDLASQLLGMEQLMMALLESPEVVDELLDFCRAVTTRYAFALIAAGGRSTSIGEPVSGPDLISPAHYRRFALPQQRRLADDLRTSGIVLANHICGNTIPIIADYVESGARILEIDHKTDLARARDAAAGRVCLLGAIDTSILAMGTPADVTDACRGAIEVMGTGGGFILGPGCAMGPETPPENIHALVESVRRFGVASR
jgi:uroporphyrinogen decarboxylase